MLPYFTFSFRIMNLKVCLCVVLVVVLSNVVYARGMCSQIWNSYSDIKTLLGGSILLLEPFKVLLHALCSHWFFTFCSYFIQQFSLLLFHLSLPHAAFYFSSCSMIISFTPLLDLTILGCSLIEGCHFHALCTLHYFRPCSLLPWVPKGIICTVWMPLVGIR